MRLILGALGALLALTGPVLAGSPTPPDPERDAQRAESVLLVRVTGIDPGRMSTLEPSISGEADGPARVASYEMLTVLKGEAPSDLRFAVPQAPAKRLTGGAPDPFSSCNSWPFPQVGERWLLYQYGGSQPGLRALLLSSADGQTHWQWWQSHQAHTVKP